MEMIPENAKIRITQKGAAWLALRESGLIKSDSIDADEERFDLFWENFKEYQQPIILDLIARCEGATETACLRKLKLVATISTLIGVVGGVLITITVKLLQ